MKEDIRKLIQKKFEQKRNEEKLPTHEENINELPTHEENNNELVMKRTTMSCVVMNRTQKLVVCCRVQQVRMQIIISVSYRYCCADKRN